MKNETEIDNRNRQTINTERDAETRWTGSKGVSVRVILEGRKEQGRNKHRKGREGSCRSSHTLKHTPNDHSSRLTAAVGGRWLTSYNMEAWGAAGGVGRGEEM